MKTMQREYEESSFSDQDKIIDFIQLSLVYFRCLANCQ